MREFLGFKEGEWVTAGGFAELLEVGVVSEEAVGSDGPWQEYDFKMFVPVKMIAGIPSRSGGYEPETLKRVTFEEAQEIIARRAAWQVEHFSVEVKVAEEWEIP